MLYTQFLRHRKAKMRAIFVSVILKLYNIIAYDVHLLKTLAMDHPIKCKCLLHRVSIVNLSALSFVYSRASEC